MSNGNMLKTKSIETFIHKDLKSNEKLRQNTEFQIIRHVR